MAVLTDLHAMGTAPSFYPAVLTSCDAVLPGAGSMGDDALLWPSTSFLAAVVVLLIINLGVSLPNAPANLGSYQFFCVLGLSVFEVEKTTATGFSFFAFLALTLPLAFLGFAALLRSGISLRSMREKVKGLPRKAARSAT